MRGFTQSLVNALLGWIRLLVEGVWDLIFSNETQQWLQWVADNWLTLVVFLCLCGVVIDYLIWILRWRPYYVWASSMRRMRRFFGGGKARDEKKAPMEHTRPLPAPVSKRIPPPVVIDEGYDEDSVWEEQNQEQPYWEQTDSTWADTPAVTADTIMARPRKADYQEQYVRRFARPEMEPEESTDLMGDPIEDWSEPQQEYVPETVQEEESWAPETPSISSDQPLHPGIDYQALSRQYGWHKDGQNPGMQTLEQNMSEEQLRERDTQESSGPAWNFSGLVNFSPYRAPAPPPEQEQCSERARKIHEGSTTLSRMKSGLSRIAKRASKVLTVDDEETGKLIDGLPPPIDKRRAFHAPVYPNRPGTDTKKSPDFREDD